MKLFLRSTGLAGFLLFALLFLAAFTSPIHIERAAKEFIQAQVAAKARDTIDGAAHSRFEKAAGILAKELREEIVDLKQKLYNGLPEKVAAAIAQMQDLTCECRKKLGSDIRQSYEWRIASLESAEAQLIELIQGQYVEVVDKLMRDLRIFTGANAVAFLMLLIVSSLNARASAHLTLPGMLLLVSTLVSGYFYLFAQNWFFTIVYNDYVGYGYIAYLSFIFAVLCDVVLNRARVTTEIINSLLSAVGQAGSLSPC